MSRERVIVVSHEASGQLLKVCESWDAYDEWIAGSEWEPYDVDTWSAAVYPEGDDTPTIARPPA